MPSVKRKQDAACEASDWWRSAMATRTKQQRPPEGMGGEGERGGPEGEATAWGQQRRAVNLL